MAECAGCAAALPPDHPSPLCKWCTCWCGAQKMPNRVQCDGHRKPVTIGLPPVPFKPKYAKHPKWWTKERCIAALQRFYRTNGTTPVSTVTWGQATQTPRGTPPSRRAYPSVGPLLSYWPTMRAAWEAAGVTVDRSWEDYSAVEDWYLREAIGIIPREEIARDMRRSDPAIKRHLYELGLSIITAHGLGVSRVERYTGVPTATIEKYMAWGQLPYFRGSKVVYLDPADLPVVREIDWQNVDPALTDAVIRALRRRLVLILAGQDWRLGRKQQAHKTVTPQPRGRHYERRIAPPKGTRPNNVDQGDVVRVTGPVPEGRNVVDREGVVKFVYWSKGNYARNPFRDFTHGMCWMARVEFVNMRGGKRAGQRVHYSIPLDLLERVAREGGSEPEEERTG